MGSGPKEEQGVKSTGLSMTVMGTDGNNRDPNMTPERLAKLKADIARAKDAAKTERKNSKKDTKPTAKSAAKAKAKATGKSKTKSKELEENSLDSEEELSDDFTLPPESSDWSEDELEVLEAWCSFVSYVSLIPPYKNFLFKT